MTCVFREGFTVAVGDEATSRFHHLLAHNIRGRRVGGGCILMWPQLQIGEPPADHSEGPRRNAAQNHHAATEKCTLRVTVTVGLARRRAEVTVFEPLWRSVPAVFIAFTQDWHDSPNGAT